MMTEEILRAVNEAAKTAKCTGLTPGELVENSNCYSGTDISWYLMVLENMGDHSLVVPLYVGEDAYWYANTDDLVVSGNDDDREYMVCIEGCGLLAHDQVVEYHGHIDHCVFDKIKEGILEYLRGSRASGNWGQEPGGLEKRKQEEVRFCIKTTLA